MILANIFQGPMCVLRAVALIARHPKLIPLALVPAVLTMVLSFVGLLVVLVWGDDLLARIFWTAPDRDAAYALWWVVIFLAKLSMAAFALLFTPWLVMLLALPLCEPLAARADALLGGVPVEGRLLREIFDALATTAGMTAVGIAGGIGLFILSFIPGAGVVLIPFAVFVWTPLFLAFDLLDSSLSRRQLKFRQKLNVLTTSPLRAISLGLSGGLLVSIPVLNLLGLPVAVVAGVIAVREREKRGELPRALSAELPTESDQNSSVHTA